MSLSESCGSSGKRQENGDVTSEERPLKKARFAWQVKGRYNLKKETNGEFSQTNNNIVNKDKIIEVLDKNHTGVASDSKDLKPAGNTEQNIEFLSDYLLKQDMKTITDSTAGHSGSSRSIPLREVSSTSNIYPRFEIPHDFVNETIIQRNVYDECLMRKLLEEAYIAKWQRNQIARGHVDNTINQVLESWTTSPAVRGRALASNIVNFINNLSNTHGIEDEAILMAISAHGLQHYSSTSTEESINENPEPDQSQNERINEPKGSNQELISETENLLDKSDVEQEVHVVPSPCASTPPTDLIQDSNSNQDVFLFEYDSSNSIPDHCEFMDAAVTFAIQNIGLTPHIG